MSDIYKLPLPKYLREHRADILAVFQNASGWGYDPEKWQEDFENDKVTSTDLNIIVQKCPEKISRSDVRYFGLQTQSGGHAEIRRLFLACMIWGWGNRGRGRRNTENSLSNLRFKGALLKKTMERIKNGEILEAYKRFELPYCRPAFFTKFFYFVGLSYDIRPLPVILDTNVAKFLEFLDRQEGYDLFKLLVKVNRDKKRQISSIRSYPEGYIRYIYCMDDWAKELGCRADNIEYYMFKEGKKLARSMKVQTDRQNNEEINKMSPEQEERETDDGTKRLPLDKVRVFAEEKRLYAVRDYIQELRVVGGGYQLREGMAMKAFQKNKCWDEFKSKWWKEGNRESGGKRTKRYEQLVDYLTDISTGKRPHDELGLLDEKKLQQGEGKVTIQLNPEKLRLLQDEAKDLTTDASTLVGMWVVERLRQLGNK